MKKSILSRNYSLLILVLLILYITFINLPVDTINMTGGAVIDLNNPYLGMDDDKLIRNLEKYSALYKYLKNYIWVYVVVVVILLGLTGYFAYTQYVIQGIPIAGINPGLQWDQEGIQFLSYFYQASKEKYNLFPPSVPREMDPKIIDNFEEDFDKFILTGDGTARKAIDLFCNTIAPCNMCNCFGPDPNYAGPFNKSPMIGYGGKDPVRKVNCLAVNDTGKANPADATNAVIKMQKKRGISHLDFARIPNCCCHLWKSALGESINFTAPKLQTFIRDLDTTKQEIGISSSTGCEPSNPGNPTPLTGKIGGVESTVKPHFTPSGVSTYVFNMIKGCIEKDGLTDLANLTFDSVNSATVTNLSPDFMKCANYDTDLDEGLSPGFMLKNASKYNTPSAVTVRPSTGLLDVSPSWSQGIWNETTGVAPVIKPVKPSNWPTVLPFVPLTSTGTKNVNNYWYKSSSGIIYQLNVNNRLFEVGAFPVKKVDEEVYDTELKDAGAKAYLDSFLSTAALAANPDIFMYQGSYYVP